MRYNTPETFAVGEQVLCRHDEKLISVEVVAVRGDEVDVATLYGKVLTFRFRAFDGLHVGRFAEVFHANPDIIFHPKTLAPKEDSLFRRLVGAFS